MGSSNPLQPFRAHLSDLWSHRRAGLPTTEGGYQQEEGDGDSGAEEQQDVDECHPQPQNQGASRELLLSCRSRCASWYIVTLIRLSLPDTGVLSWESSSWAKQREEVSEHLRGGGLYQESISQRFTFDDKEVLLQQSNLQPTRWSPEQSHIPIPAAVCPAYYQVTILGNVWELEFPWPVQARNLRQDILVFLNL